MLPKATRLQMQEAQLPKPQRCVPTTANAALPSWLLHLHAERMLTRGLFLQERANASSRGTSGGKLSANLEAQKKQTRNALLTEGSQEEQRARAADAAIEARNYN